MDADFALTPSAARPPLSLHGRGVGGEGETRQRHQDHLYHYLIRFNGKNLRFILLA